MGRSLRINVQKAGHSPLCKSVSHGVVSHQPYQERTTPFHLVLETMIVVTNFVVVEWMKHFKLNINILVKLGFGWVSKWCGPKKTCRFLNYNCFPRQNLPDCFRTNVVWNWPEDMEIHLGDEFLWLFHRKEHPSGWTTLDLFKIICLLFGLELLDEWISPNSDEIPTNIEARGDWSISLPGSALFAWLFGGTNRFLGLTRWETCWTNQQKPWEWMICMQWHTVHRKWALTSYK